jgi:hypothetical protein
MQANQRGNPWHYVVKAPRRERLLWVWWFDVQGASHIRQSSQWALKQQLVTRAGCEVKKWTPRAIPVSKAFSGHLLAVQRMNQTNPKGAVRYIKKLQYYNHVN